MNAWLSPDASIEDLAANESPVHRGAVALRRQEPVDLAQYHQQHPDFPQEPMLDQISDEAQWEKLSQTGAPHPRDSLQGPFSRVQEVDFGIAGSVRVAGRSNFGVTLRSSLDVRLRDF